MYLGDSFMQVFSKLNESLACFFYAIIKPEREVFNMYNPYAQNTQFYPPYNNMTAMSQMPQARQEIIKVHGEDGAKAYQLAPNSSVLLLDDISPIIWLKQSDGAGYPTLTPYTITPYQKEPETNIKSLEERIQAIEERLNNESNITSVKSKKSNE